MLPVQGIAAGQVIDQRYLPGNTFYVFSLERIAFGGSQKRDVVFGGSSLPAFVFVPIVDFPQMGKNFAPVANYALALQETNLSSQLSNADRLDGGLPMSRKLAIHCVSEIVENYRPWGVVDLGALTGLSRDDVARVYSAVLPPYITKPGLEAVKRAMGADAAGRAHFLIDEVRLLDANGKEFEPDLNALLEDCTGKNYNPNLEPGLHEVAANVQAAIRHAIESAIEYRQRILNIETAEVSASKTNGGKGQTSYSTRANRYAKSLGLKLVDPVYQQAKDTAPVAAPVAPVAPAPVEIPGLTDAMNAIATALGHLRAPSAVATAKPAANKPAPANANKNAVTKED